MATKEQLEMQAKAKEEERKRLRGPTIQSPVGGPVSQMMRNKRETGELFPPPAKETPPPAASPTPQTDQQKFLAEQGVNEFAQNMDPTRYNQNPTLRRQTIQGQRDTLAERTSPALRGVQQAIPAGKLQRAGQEMLANTQYTNLGNFGTEGGPNIYGRSSTPGGRIDTFAGAGTPETPEQTNARNTALYNNSDPFNLTGQSARPVNNSLRAGQRQFGNQGRGGVRMRELRNINNQANRAFANALESGMNTKAALRVADNIRAGARTLTDQDRVDALRYGADANLAGDQLRADAQLAAAGLREQGAIDRANAAALAEIDAQELELLKGLSYTTDADGNRVFDQENYSRSLLAAGGFGGLRGKSADAKNALFRQGSNVSRILENVNRQVADQGIRYDNLSDLVAGGGKLEQSDATLLDALRSKNVDWNDILFKDKLKLKDGNLITVEDFFGLESEEMARLTLEEREALIEFLE